MSRGAVRGTLAALVAAGALTPATAHANHSGGTIEALDPAGLCCLAGLRARAIVRDLRRQARHDRGARAALAAASSVLGTPYTWGGGAASGDPRNRPVVAGASALHCSGPDPVRVRPRRHRARPLHRAQLRVGRHSGLEQVPAGDLVFFGRDAHHVGLYLGRGLMVHAPTPAMSSASPHSPGRIARSSSPPSAPGRSALDSPRCRGARPGDQAGAALRQRAACAAASRRSAASSARGAKSPCRGRWHRAAPSRRRAAPAGARCETARARAWDRGRPPASAPSPGPGLRSHRSPPRCGARSAPRPPAARGCHAASAIPADSAFARTTPKGSAEPARAACHPDHRDRPRSRPSAPGRTAPLRCSSAASSALPSAAEVTRSGAVSSRSMPYW